MGSKKRFERRELLKVIKKIFTRFECLLQVLAGSQRVMPGVMPPREQGAFLSMAV